MKVYTYMFKMISIVYILEFFVTTYKLIRRFTKYFWVTKSRMMSGWARSIHGTDDKCIQQFGW
jgi:hypothetical protein